MNKSLNQRRFYKLYNEVHERSCREGKPYPDCHKDAVDAVVVACAREAFEEFVESVDAAIDKPTFPPRCTQELADEIQIASVKARKALYG